MIERRGLMLVLSSPSGAGKTSLSRCLLDVEPDIALSVSATTRPRRPGEVEGNITIFWPRRILVPTSPRAIFSNMPKCLDIIMALLPSQLITG
jgi:hypothetical protein